MKTIGATVLSDLQAAESNCKVAMERLETLERQFEQGQNCRSTPVKLSRGNFWLAVPEDIGPAIIALMRSRLESDVTEGAKWLERAAKSVRI